MAQTKTEAVLAIIRDARSERVSQTGINRVIRACKILGLDQAETFHVLAYLDYSDICGNPHLPKFSIKY